MRLRRRSNAVRRETLEYRTAISRLNAELAQNRQALLTADNAAKKTLETRNRQIRAETGLLRARQQTSALTLSALQQERRELGGLSGAQQQATRSTGLFSRAAGELVGNLSSFAVFAATDGLVRFAQGTVAASARLQLLRTGLENVTGSSAAAEQRLRELDEVARLPGANLDALVQYNNRLTAIGLTGEEIDSILLNVGQSIVSLGGNAVLAEQSLEQISQALQNNIVDLRDFRPIIQRVPGFLQAIADVHGVAPTLDGFREAVARLGGSVKDALLPVLEELGNRFAAPPPESYVRSIDELQNAYFLFSATLGDSVLPSVAAAARGLTAFFDAFREHISPTDDARVALQTFREALSDADTILESSAAIDARINYLDNLKEALFDAANELDKFDRKGRERLQGEVDDANEEIGTLTLIQSGDVGVTQLQSEIEDLIDSYSKLVAEETKREAQTQLTHLAVSNVAAARLKVIREEKDEVASQIEQFQGYVKVAEAAERGLVTAFQPDSTSTTEAGKALDALGESQARTVQRTKELTGEIITAEQAHRNLTAVVDSTNLAYNDFQSRIQASALAVAGFTGVIEGVQEPFTAYTAVIHASNAALEEEAKALATVTQRLIQQTQDAEALVHIQEVLTERTDAHNAALVNPIVTEATQRIRAYATALDSTQFSTQALTEITSDSMDRIREFTDAVLTSEGVLNNFAPALGEVETRYIGLESVTDRLTASIRDQASAFDELRQKVERFNQSESQRRQQRGIQPPRLPGETITSERALGDLDRLFGTDPRSRSRQEESETASIEAQRESIQLYNDLSAATVDFTGSLIDLKGETNLADHAFQDFLGTFGRLATGDFTALLDIPIQLLNISRQAAAEREQGARDRAALYEEQFGEFERFGRNFDVVSGVLGIPESPELSDSLFFNPAGEFENVLAQSTADFSDGIKNALLASVVNLERDIRPEDIAGIFQSSIDALGENLDQSQFNLNFDQQLGRDTADAYQSLINDTTTFYQAQIDAINLVRQATGNLSFGDPEALARQAQAETNQLRLAAPPSGPQNAQQILTQHSITHRARIEHPGPTINAWGCV